MDTPSFTGLFQQSAFLLGGKIALGCGGLIGLLALLHPRAFAKLAQIGGMWLDTRTAFEKIDRPVYIDLPVVRYSRAFGVCVLAGAAVLAWLARDAGNWAVLAWSVSAAVAAVGLVALVWPGCFRRLAAVADVWIDTSRFTAILDRRVDIDACVIRHSRAFGIFVLAALVCIAVVL